MARIDQRSEDLDIREPFRPTVPIQPAPPPVPQRGIGTESKTLYDFIFWGVAALYYRLVELGGFFDTVVDGFFDTEVADSPEVFVMLGQSAATAVTPGTPTKIYQNEGQLPVSLHVRLEPFQSGTTALLILDDNQANCTKAKAKVVKDGYAPSTRMVVLPNQVIFADCTDPSAGVQATFNVVVVPTTLPRGRRGVLGENV